LQCFAVFYTYAVFLLRHAHDNPSIKQHLEHSGPHEHKASELRNSLEHADQKREELLDQKKEKAHQEVEKAKKIAAQHKQEEEYLHQRVLK